MSSLRQLRAHAVARSLFAPTTLSQAIERLGFVQADPIRSPARAQDLILRLRVEEYRAGDLERQYPSLELEEDLLYAYGFVSRTVWQLLHPRRASSLSALDKRIFAAVRALGPTHPSELEHEFGRKRVTNAWGGYSKQTTRALERLHHRGLLRVVGRESGIRVYQAAPEIDQQLSPKGRLRRLVLAVANLLSPVPEATLSAIASRLGRHLHGVASHRAVLAELLRSGELEPHAVDDVNYLWLPADPPQEAEPRVRFLAPFDPLVWDRKRFEHLWEWSYRFEAYTPASKRVRGYYALPLLWRDRVVGWANAGVDGERLRLEVGFAGSRPRGREFTRELEAERARLAAFLGVRD